VLRCKVNLRLRLTFDSVLGRLTGKAFRIKLWIPSAGSTLKGELIKCEVAEREAAADNSSVGTLLHSGLI
jgi:hypothetical protein